MIKEIINSRQNKNKYKQYLSDELINNYTTIINAKVDDINKNFISDKSDDIYTLIINLPYDFISKIYKKSILPVIKDLPECIKM